MGKQVIDLDDVILSTEVIDRWNSHLESTLGSMLDKHSDLAPEEIPNECLVIDGDGNCSIQVKIRGTIIKMPIKNEDWEYQ